MKIVSILDNLNKIKNQTILLRLDLNVPLAGKKIFNDYKLVSSLPTIKLLQRNGCSIIILTHLGEPKLPLTKQDFLKYSTKPLASWLSKKLKTTIKVLPVTWPEIRLAVKKMSRGDVLLMENIRFFRGETYDSQLLAKQLASLAQVYVNDAFAVCHRAHSSVSAIKNYLPSYAGPLLVREIDHLEKARLGKKPLLLIMGGAKLSTKLPLLKNLAPKAKMVLTGGGIANTILKSQGKEVGKSLIDPNAILAYSQAKFKNIMVPIDVGVLANNRRQDKKTTEVKANDLILDIGPKTVKLYGEFIKRAKTIIWNGPMGMFEKKLFASGNHAVAKLVAEATDHKVFTLIGGGETVAALDKKFKFSWVSTGGGAALSYLEGKKLPGLSKLIK